jgi:hypothetical protein
MMSKETVASPKKKKREIKTKKLLVDLYLSFRKKILTVVTPMLVPSTSVHFGFIPIVETAYCRLDGKHYRIIFGGQLFIKKLGLPPLDSYISKVVAREKLDDIIQMFKFLYYHEIGHLIYTDMSCMLIPEYKVPELRNALHTLFNTLEDVHLEECGLRKDYPYTNKILDRGLEVVFDKDTLTKYSDMNDATSFFIFLLYKLRRPKVFKGTNAFFEKHKPEMITHIKECLSESHPTKRIERIIVFFEWLVSLEEIDFKSHPMDEIEKVPFGRKEKSETPSGRITTGSSPEKFEGESKSGTLEETEEEKEGGDEDDGEGADEDDAESPEDAEKDSDIDEEEFIESTFDSLGSDSLTHQVYFAEENIIVSPKSEEYVEKAIESMAKVTTDVVNVIKTFKTRHRPKYLPGYSQGKLHVSSAIAGKPVNIFKKKVGKALDNSLSIKILCDNSGSMAGDKSTITTKALLAMTNACSKLNVPIEVSAFTATSDSSNAEIQTLILKKFSQRFDMTKKYFGCIDHDGLSGIRLRDFSTLNLFGGNKDELNIDYLCKEYLKEPYNKKVLIVLSDGATTGSSEDLKQLVAHYVSKGIFIIGLGIQTSSVKYLYDNYKVFNTTEELNGLAVFLGEMLLDLAKGDK